MDPGDVIIILQQKEHETFTRSRNDLYLTQTIGLTEALCGFQIVVKQLDGRDLLISNPPGEVVHPGNVFLFSLSEINDSCLSDFGNEFRFDACT